MDTADRPQNATHYRPNNEVPPVMNVSGNGECLHQLEDGRQFSHTLKKRAVAEQLRHGKSPIEVLESLPEWNPVQFWGVVDFLAAHRRFAEALQVFDWWKAQPKYRAREQHYTTFIRMFGRARRSDIAQELFEEMKAVGIRPSVASLSSLLQGYAENGFFDRAEEILKEMEDSTTKPNAVTHTGLIYAYGKQGRYDYMTRVFNTMKRNGYSPEFHTYRCLIEAYSKGGLFSRMENTWREMDSNGFKPDPAIINSIIQGYADYGLMEQMNNTYMLLKDYRMFANRSALRSMAVAYIRCNKFYQLGLFVKEVGLKRRDVENLLWNSLLLSYAANFQMRSLQKEFQAMMDVGFNPDLTTFNIRALGFSKMLMFWDLHVTVLHMHSVGVAPDMVTFGAVVDAYINGRMRFQKMFEALDELRMKGLAPDVRTDPMVFEAFGKGDFHNSCETLLQITPRPYGVTWTYGLLTSFYLKKRAAKELSPGESQLNLYAVERLLVHEDQYIRIKRNNG